MHALQTLTEHTGSAGIAIILLTIIIRTLMLPLSLIQIRSQKSMQRLQPQLRELQQKYGNDRQRMAQEQMRLYKEGGVNPVAGCLPLVLQMPIWFALYSALITLANNDPSFQEGFLWIPSLAHPDPLYILPIVTGVTQWVVQRMSMMPTSDPQQQQMNRMMEFMPIMFFFFSLQVASGLALYWVISNLYTFVQQYFTMGWGTLPFLGNKGSSGKSGNTGGNSGSSKSDSGSATSGSGTTSGPNGSQPVDSGNGRARSPRRGAGPSTRRRKK
jgi:YidC/Oxa1 family membrane protein insertase